MAKYQLVMSTGPAPGQTFDLIDADITLGRDIQADIVVNVPEISRRHVRFRKEAGGYMIEDLGSTNGTFVNGQRLSAPYLLRSGDAIMLGEAVAFIFEGGDFDPNATVVSPASQGDTLPPTSSPSSKDPTMYAPEPVPVPPPQFSQSVQIPKPAPTFSGQVPPGPADFGDEMPLEEPRNRMWLWAGLGCLVVILCGCVAGAILFDMANMYCQTPFDSLFSFLYTCP